MLIQYKTKKNIFQDLISLKYKWISKSYILQMNHGNFKEVPETIPKVS